MPAIAALLLLSACSGDDGGPIEPPPSDPTGAVRAQVRDDQNALLAGIAIVLEHDTLTRNGVTGTDGVALFADLPVGAATVSVTAPAAYRPLAAQAVTIAEDDTTQTNLRLTLRAGTINVTVRDSSGGFVPDVRVVLSGSPERVAITDGLGRASFGRVPAGSATVTVADTALGDFETSASVDVADAAATAVMLLTPSLARGAWHEVEPMPSARASLAAVAHDGAIYVLGGSGSGGAPADVLVFDGVDWDVETTLAQGLNAPAAAVIGDELFVIGGFVGTGNSPTGAVSIYDFTTQQWSAGTAMPTSRGGIQAAVLNGRIHVVGGGNSSSTLAAHEAYDPATNTWATLAALPSSRGNPALAVLDGKLYAIGGASGGSVFSRVDVFDPVANAWSVGPSLPGGRVAARAVVYGGELYVFGGELTFTGALDDVYRLNAARDGWVRMTRMPGGRSYAGAALLDDGVYLVGGSRSSATDHAESGIEDVVRYVLP